MRDIWLYALGRTIASVKHSVVPLDGAHAAFGQHVHDGNRGHEGAIVPCSTFAWQDLVNFCFIGSFTSLSFVGFLGFIGLTLFCLMLPFVFSACFGHALVRVISPDNPNEVLTLFFTVSLHYFSLT